MQDTPIQPLNDFVVILPDAQDETTQSGRLVIPDMARDRALQGVVLAVGPGRTENRVLIATSVKVGDRVMYGKYAGADLKIAGVNYLVMREEEIHGVLTEQPQDQSSPTEAQESNPTERTTIRDAVAGVETDQLP